jgi:hypothetical protein
MALTQIMASMEMPVASMNGMLASTLMFESMK